LWMQQCRILGLIMDKIVGAPAGAGQSPMLLNLKATPFLRSGTSTLVVVNLTARRSHCAYRRAGLPPKEIAGRYHGGVRQPRLSPPPVMVRDCLPGGQQGVDIALIGGICW